MNTTSQPRFLSRYIECYEEDGPATYVVVVRSIETLPNLDERHHYKTYYVCDGCCAEWRKELDVTHARTLRR